MRLIRPGKCRRLGQRQLSFEPLEVRQCLSTTPLLPTVGEEPSPEDIAADEASGDVVSCDAGVRIRLQASDLDGNPIDHISVGEDFLLQAFVKDLRADVKGVFAGYLDITYDESLVSMVGHDINDIAFGDFYQNGRSGSFGDGLIDDVGAFGGMTLVGSAEHLLFAVCARADRPGEVEFTGDPAERYEGANVLVFGRNHPVPWSSVEFVPATVVINDETQGLLGEIHGMKFNDLDGDSERDAGEPGLEGWTIYLDTNRNGELDEGERSTKTNANGDYWFTELGPETYTVAEVPQEGWKQTAPNAPNDTLHPVLWHTDLNESGRNDISEIKLTPDGEHAIVFHYSDSSVARIQKIEAHSGDVVWDKALTLNGKGIYSGWVDDDGIYIGSGWGGYTISKYDTDLSNELWFYRGGSGFEYVENIVTDAVGNVYATAYTGSGSGVGSTCVKLDSNGNVLWEQLSRHTSGKDKYTFGLALDSVGNVFRVGIDRPSNNLHDIGRLIGHSAADGAEIVNLALPMSNSQIGGVLVDENDHVWIAYSYDIFLPDGSLSGESRTVIQELELDPTSPDGATIVREFEFDTKGTWVVRDGLIPYTEDAFLLAYQGTFDGVTYPGIAAFSYGGELLWNRVIDQADWGWGWGPASPRLKGTGVDVAGDVAFVALTNFADQSQSQVVAVKLRNSPATYTIALGPEEVAQDIDFANHGLGEIHGTKFNDLDGDSEWDPSEPGLEGWTIYLDANQNGQLDDGERAMTTNANGDYSFTGLGPDTYMVAEVPRDGWEQTYPGNVYEMDFSSNPDWVSNNEAHYHWNASEGTYHITQTNIPGGGEYTYFDTDYDGGSFRLEWDVKMLSNDYASAVTFGLVDSDLNFSENGSFARVNFLRRDDGLKMTLCSRDSANKESFVRHPNQFSHDVWYHVVMEHDADAGTLSAMITVRDTGGQLASLSLSDVGTFAADMSRIGSSNVRNGTFQVPGAQSSAKIDNVVFAAMPAHRVTLEPGETVQNVDFGNQPVNPLIDVGEHVLLPDTPGQVIPIYVSGGSSVQGVVFNVQVADGYDDVPCSTTDGPNIANVDLVGTETVFGGISNTGNNIIETRDQIWIVGAATSTGTVAADGLLANLTIDTTGWFGGEGPWQLRLGGTFNGDTNFQSPEGQIVPAIINGSIRIDCLPQANPDGPYTVPEGGSIPLDGSRSSDPDPGDTITRYEWDLDGDGVFGETGQTATRGDELGANPTFSAMGLDGPDTWTVWLRVTDDRGGRSSPVSSAITVKNVTPLLASVVDQTIHRVHSLNLENLPITFTDAGISDVHRATVDWGDGLPAEEVTVIEPTGTNPGEVRAGHSYTAAGLYTVTVSVEDDDGGASSVSFGVDVIEAHVVGRHVFYNNSAWDGNDPLANAEDDSAVASEAPILDPTDLIFSGNQQRELGKEALLPGETATFANYTSYSRGLNSIMVDIDGLAGTPTAVNFVFLVGNNNDPTTWSAASAPMSITVRPGAGVDGSDRITLIWADDDPHTSEREPGSISNQWLQITVLATANTGLAEDDVFYFGNAIGESGNSTAETDVDTNDELGARNHPHSVLNPAPIEDAYDYNRDRRVDTNDEIVARNNSASAFTRLQLITAPCGTDAREDEATGNVEAARSFHNVEQPTDVNADGIVSILDVQEVVDALNDDEGPVELPPIPVGPLAALPCVDTDNDGLLTPRDALLVINAIKDSTGENNESAEGEAPTAIPVFVAERWVTDSHAASPNQTQGSGVSTSATRCERPILQRGSVESSRIAAREQSLWSDDADYLWLDFDLEESLSQVAADVLSVWSA